MQRDSRISMICVGDELLDGSIRDLNMRTLGSVLVDHGLKLDSSKVIRDGVDLISEALEKAVGIVVVSGGLGPTQDDVTRDGAAAWAGVQLAEDRESLETLRRRFEERNYPFTDNNRRQAFFPVGADILPNPRGSAPGFKLKVAGTTAYFFPGVPSEFQAFCETHLAPELAQGTGVRTRLYFHGLGESQLETRLDGIEALAKELGSRVGYRADYPEIEVKLAADSDEALESAVAFVESKIGLYAIGRDDEDISTRVGRLLMEQGATVTTAESCTAGGIAAKITDISGSSSWFEQGFVTYSNAAKHALIGVSNQTLERYGAVSAQVVTQMAAGARERAGATHALAVSGIAGPGGGTAEKPVGTVHFGLASPEGVYHQLIHFRVRTRERIRAGTVYSALAMLLWRLDGQSEHPNVRGPFAVEDVNTPEGITIETDA